MRIPLNDTFSFTAGTHSPTTGAVTNADSTPVFDVYQGTNDTPILANQTMTQRGSATGTYRGTFTVSVANGFLVGSWCNVVTKATVGGIAAIIPDEVFRVDVAEASAGCPVVTLTTAEENAIRDAVFARAFSSAYNNFTFDQIVKIMLSALGGTSSGLGTSTAAYNKLSGGGAVITATVDAVGNRSAVTLTP